MENPRRVYELVNGQPVLTLEEWGLDEYHRVDGPAIREWEIVNTLPVLTREEWWLNGQSHRVDGPAVRDWETGVLTYEAWSIEGGLHRVDGPARQEWSIVDGESRLETSLWCLWGKAVDPLILNWAAVVIQRWFLRHRHRREIIISSLLQADGLTVFPGLMQLLRRY